MWLMAFILAFAGGVIGTLSPYVASSFGVHSLTALTGVLANLIAGIWKLPFAKMMNIWGRPQALVIGITAITIGLIMMAGCKNIQTYCAAQVFFYLGSNSINFSITVFVADTSKLKNRGFFLAYAASPWLITTWIYGYAVDGILPEKGGVGYGWGFGIFAIVVPLTCVPLTYMFYANENKARRQGLFEANPSRGTAVQTVLYYLREFDVIGLFILALGLSLFLLAFNIYSYQAEQWESPLILAFLVVGFILTFVVFTVWEKYGAPVTFVPWELLKNRTVIFTYVMAGALYVGWYAWNSYFYSLLIVYYNQTVIHATYVSNIYTMGSCFTSLVFGVALRYYGKLKIYSLFWGVPFTVLGCGIMLNFLNPGEAQIGYVAMGFIFISFGGGVLVIAEQTTLMAVSKQQDFPALLACEAMIIAIGGAIGSTIAGAIWTGVFPVRLTTNLPEEAMANFTMIYGVIETQSSYPWGSPTRNAINLSYEQTQKYLYIAGTAIYATMFVSVALWENVDVRKMKQRTFGLL
jgi:MFS family permease